MIWIYLILKDIRWQTSPVHGWICGETSLVLIIWGYQVVAYFHTPFATLLIGKGLPFPEAQPYKPSLLYGTLMKGNAFIQDVFKKNPDVRKTTLGSLTKLGGDQ